MKTTIISNISKISSLRHTLTKLVDFILYTHILIGLCAMSSTLHTKFLLLGIEGINLSLEVVFIFSSTISLYILHRLIGINSINIEKWPTRFLKIRKSEKINIALLILNSIIALVCFIKFNLHLKLSLLFPIIISLAYILPIFNGKRLRDFNFIKLILIATIWGWLSVIIPIQYLGISIESNHWMLYIEKVLFIFAITIPFDIRDNEIDQRTNLATISTTLSIQKSKRVAIVSLFVALIIDFVLYQEFQFLSFSSLMAYVVTYSICGVLVIKSDPSKEDYYFTGYIDGTMILLLALVILFGYLS